MIARAVHHHPLFCLLCIQLGKGVQSSSELERPAACTCSGKISVVFTGCGASLTCPGHAASPLLKIFTFEVKLTACQCINEAACHHLHGSKTSQLMRQALAGLPSGPPFARHCSLKATDAAIIDVPSHGRNAGIWRNAILRRFNEIKGCGICCAVSAVDHARSGFGNWHVPTRRAHHLPRTVSRPPLWLPVTHHHRNASESGAPHARRALRAVLCCAVM